MGSVEIYSHAKDSHGFIFIVNPQYWEGRSICRSTPRLGLLDPINARFPNSILLGGSGSPNRVHLPQLGTSIHVHAPAQTVLVLEVKPLRKRSTDKIAMGFPARSKRRRRAIWLKTWGQQGRTERCAVLLPEEANPYHGECPRRAKAAPSDCGPIHRFILLRVRHDCVAMDVTFRRDAAPDELRKWDVKSGSLADGTTAGWKRWFQGRNYPNSFRCSSSAAGVNLPMLGCRRR